MVRKVNFNENIQIIYYEIDEIDEIDKIDEKIKQVNIINEYIKKFFCKCKNLCKFKKKK